MVALPRCHVRLRGQKAPPSAYPRGLRTLGDHLRKHRLDLSLLQREVAVRIGADGATVTNWELNHTQPALRFMPAIYRFLGYVPFPLTGGVGERLRAHRIIRGWSQKRFARELGVDPSTLAKWEREERVPTGGFLCRIQAVLSMSRDVLGAHAAKPVAQRCRPARRFPSHPRD